MTKDLKMKVLNSIYNIKMVNELQRYIEEVIKKGDEGSSLLAALTAPTLGNQMKVGSLRVLDGGMNGLTVLDVPKTHSVMVHSVGADPNIADLSKYSESLVNNLIKTSYPDSIPVAFANVVDSNTGNIEMIKTIGNALAKTATTHNLAILNGENAVLGDRVSSDANLSGTMISLVHNSKLNVLDGIIKKGDIEYAFFDPEGKPVLINSDGVGTKTEFYERSGKYHLAIEDFMAMNLDDAIKIAAKAKVISGVLEYTKGIPTDHCSEHLEQVAWNMGILGILQPENLEGRIRGYNDSTPTFNISGSVVSTIDEERLTNPLKPSEGDLLIAIKSKNPNPRSNGITARRTLMNQLGEEWLKGTEFNEWHETNEGKEFLEYLSTPSTIFYPVFSELIEKGLATSVYHMSGGAFNGKLARPLAKEGLFAEISNLFPMSGIEERLYDASGASLKTAYENWPMGAEGFITVNPSDINSATKVLQDINYRMKVVGKLELGNTGVKINTPQGEVIRFNGLD